MNQRQDETPSNWDWPATDTPVDLTSFVLREWAEPPQPAYLLKKARSAIGERTYYLLARLLDLPNAVVFWEDYTKVPMAAIRYEPAAWRPDRIDAEQGIAATGEHVERLVNPLDVYRHKALYHLLGEDDDTEYMVRNGVLFRIDAASAGDELWSKAIIAMAETLTGKTSDERWRLGAAGMVWTADRLRTDSPEGYAAYLDTLARFLRHPEWDEVVANDLRTCPAARAWRMDPSALPMDALSSAQKVLAQAWVETPLMDHIADAHLARMKHQRAAAQQLLANTDTP